MPRSKQFKPEQALGSAMSAFWRHGYEATSMEDLMDCMGIGRASIYNAFGNKRALFLAALGHYVSTGGALQGVPLRILRSRRSCRRSNSSSNGR